MPIPSGARQPTLQQLVEQARLTHQWSVRELARQCGLKPTTVYGLLDPRRSHYRAQPATLRQLAAGLDIPLPTLVLAAHGDAADDETVYRLLDIWFSCDATKRQQLIDLAEELYATAKRA